METKNRVTVGQAAWRAVKAHPGRIAALTLEQLFLRLACLAPLLLPLPRLAGYGLAILIYGLAVIPLRFRFGEALRYCSAPHQALPRGGRAYGNWLKTGLLRYLRGLLFGLPFLFCVGYLAYGWSHLPFNTMWMPILALTLPGSGAILLLSALLFAYGWWRDLPTEYIPARHLGARKTFFFVRRARKTGRKRLIQNACVNALLSLPAFVGAAAVLAPYARVQMPSSGNMQVLFSALVHLLQTPLPQAQRTQLLLVFAVLYLPLCVLRKMRSAVLIRRLTREVSNLEDGHAAG